MPGARRSSHWSEALDCTILGHEPFCWNQAIFCLVFNLGSDLQEMRSIPLAASRSTIREDVSRDSLDMEGAREARRSRRC